MKIENFVTNMTLPNNIMNLETSNQKNVNSSNFGDKFLEMVDSTEKNQKTVQTKVYELLTEGKGNSHDVIVSLQRADSQIKTMSVVRDKVVEGYKEIMRMQL